MKSFLPNTEVVLKGEWNFEDGKHINRKVKVVKVNSDSIVVVHEGSSPLRVSDAYYSLVLNIKKH